MDDHQRMTTILTPRETVGCYYNDQDGGFWSTTYCSGGLVCSDCGRTFYAGYHGPRVDDVERLSCGCQVKVKYPRRKASA